MKGVAAAFLLAGGLATAEVPLTAFKGERLYYDVSWTGMVVGHATIACLPTTNPGLIAVRTTAKANSTIQSMYPVLDTIQSLVNIQTGMPFQFRKLQHEGAYSAEIKIQFDWPRKAASVTGAAKGQSKPDTAITLEGTEYDLLSSLLHVRSGDLVPGKSNFLAMVDNRKRFASVEVICHRRETIETESGKVATLVVEPKIHGDALFASKGKLTIWMTDDSLHVPVRMESKIALGTIKAEMVRRIPPAP